MKKFERFAQRSSLRRVNSPRQGQEKSGEKDKTSDNKVNNNNNNNDGAVTTTKVTTENKMSKQTTLKSPTLAKDIRRNTVVLDKSPVNIGATRLDSKFHLERIL